MSDNNRSRGNEERFEALDNCREGVLIINEEGEVCYSNSRARELLGIVKPTISKQDLLKAFQHAIDNDFKSLSITDFPFLSPSPIPLDLKDLPIGTFRRDNSLTWISISTQAFCKTVPGYTHISLIDITSSRNNERFLSEKASSLNLTVSAVGDLIFEVDAEGTVLNYWANDPQKLFIAPSNFLNRRIRDVFPGSFADSIMSMIDNTRNTQNDQEMHYQSPFEPLPEHWYRLKIRPVPHKNGHVIVIVSDITDEIRQAEKAEMSEAKFNKAFSNSTIGMALVDLEGRFIEVNKILCEMLSYKPEELVGLRFIEVTHPDDIDPSIDRFRMLRKGERDSFLLEKRYMRSDGEIIWCLLTVSFIHDQSGRPLFFLAQIQDISLSKQHEINLIENQQQLEYVQSDLERRLKQMEEFNHIVVHHLRGPASNIEMLFQGLEDLKDEEIAIRLRLIQESNANLLGILEQLVIILEDSHQHTKNTLF